MSNTTLSSHSIRVIRTNSKNKFAFENLDKIGHVEGSDFKLFSLIYDYLDNCKTGIHQIYGNSKKIWKIDRLNFSEDRTRINGTIGCGEGGHREDIINLKTHNLEYQKQTNQAGLMKYYFMIYIPQNSTIGYLILQRIQNMGIQSIFMDMCKIIPTDSISRYSIMLENIFSKEYYERIQKKWLPKEIRITAKVPPQIPSDAADYREEMPEQIIQSTTTIEYLLKSKYKENKKIIDTIFDRIVHRSEIPLELFNDANLPTNHTRLRLVVLETASSNNGKNRRRTVKISDSEEDEMTLEKMLLPYRDITDSVVLDEDGYPTFESIDKEAQKYLAELIEEKTV